MDDFVEFWAKKCRIDMSACQKEVNVMIDSQIEIGNAFYKRLPRKKALEILLKN